MLPDIIAQTLTEKLPGSVISGSQNLKAYPVSGGSINETYRLVVGDSRFFLKYNDRERYPSMFEKEAQGLELLRQTGTIDVPRVVVYGVADAYQFLVLEWIETRSMKEEFWEIFGNQLARLHHNTADRFGLDHDNYMGSLPQSNKFHDRWVDFFVNERLEPQVKLAREHGRIARADVQAFERLYLRLDEIFPPTRPSLVHGDLWSGNYMVNQRGEPCLIDPAVYYGHPEVDIAMSTLFGGFSERFYNAFNDVHPLEKGWAQRLDYYNLYPLMIHVNLFGGGYLGSVQRILRKFY